MATKKDFTVEITKGGKTLYKIISAENEHHANMIMAQFCVKNAIPYIPPRLKTIYVGINEEAFDTFDKAQNSGDKVSWKINPPVNYTPPIKEYTVETVVDEQNKSENEAVAIKKLQKYEAEKRDLFDQKIPKNYRKPLPPTAKSYGLEKIKEDEMAGVEIENGKIMVWGIPVEANLRSAD